MNATRTYAMLTALTALAGCAGDTGVKVYNTAPAVAIQSPPSGTEIDEGDVLSFEALVDDAQDAPEDLTLSWTSDRDGVLSEIIRADADGYVDFSTASLSPGNHVITLTAVDTDNDSSDDFVKITVADLPDAPQIEIIHPIRGEVGDEGSEFEFVALVDDAQDEPEVLLVQIESDVDGVFCTPVADGVGKASCSAELSPGGHILTFTVTDTDGDIGSEQVYFEVVEGVSRDDDGDGFTEEQGDCDDADDGVYPTADEIANEIDDDCDGEIDEDTVLSDDDGDGYTELDGDCDDDDDGVYVGATEVCDGIDNDCDTYVDEGTSCEDDDGDGYAELDGDCDDASASTYPRATEIPDAADNDCDGIKDEGTVLYDDDGDCYCEDEPCTDGVDTTCASVESGDCDDADADISPDATELCDGDDNDCDGTTDEDDASDALAWYADDDSDGYGDLSSKTNACSKPSGYVAGSTDCDDASASVNPAATETCNSVDDDCDSSIDEGVTTTWYEDGDSDGYGDLGSTKDACSKPTGYVSNSTDCDDSTASVSPARTETCNSVDDDCDGTVDESDASDSLTWYKDGDSDGYGDPASTSKGCSKPSGYVASSTDCNDASAAVSPAATETCNSVDDDCDGTTDESDASDSITWYIDADADGYGVSTTTKKACSKPSGYSSVATDCNDGSSAVSPAATESCNSIDDDCDSSIDEGVTTTWYKDADSDTYGDPATSYTGCTKPTGYVTNSSDCDDTSSTYSPLTVWYIDYDGDGYGTTTTTKTQCTKPSGYALTSTDCNDLSNKAYPGATESCDSLDNDCDSSTDEENATGCSTYYYDYDADGYGSKTVSGKCLCATSGYYTSTVNTDCYDSSNKANPAATTYYTSSRGDGSYDYNCDSSSTKYYTATYDCNYDWTGFACDSYTNGFSSTVPACGSSGTWRSGCSASWFSCSYSSSSTVTQSCR